MSYRVHPSPLSCKYLCLYSSFVGSGYREKDVYCIYEEKKNNVKKKGCLKKKKAHVFLECANNFFVKMYTFLEKHKLLLHSLVVMAKQQKI